MSKSEPFTHDVIVVGAGSAGTWAALNASQQSVKDAAGLGEIALKDAARLVQFKREHTVTGSPID